MSHIAGIKKIKNKAFLMLFAAILMAPSSHSANDVFSLAVCDNPRGKTMYFDPRRASEEEKYLDIVDEGYINDPPSFIIDTRDTSTIYVKWGNKETHADVLSEKIDQNGYYQRITAVEAETNYAWMYSLFPKDGIVFISRQGNAHNQVNTLNSSFFAFCDFQ